MGVAHLPGRTGASCRPSHCASFSDFVTDHAADSSAADGSDGAAARENSATDGAYTGADGGTLVLRRHVRTSTKAEKNYCGECTERKSANRFHGLTSLSNIVFRIFHAWSTTDCDLPQHFYIVARSSFPAMNS
jgi:hypothetical protein